MRNFLIFAAALGLAGCGDGGGSSQPSAPAQPEVQAVKLSETDLMRVCKAGAAFRTGRSVKGIDSKVTADQQVRLSYTRDDGKFFRYDCLVEGHVLRFRMIDEAGPGTGPGSWSGRGSRTTFKLNPGSVELMDDFLDGSTDTGTIEI